MKINFTKKQYEDLIYALEAGFHVYGILGDAVSRENYKERSNRIEELNEYFFSFAEKFGMEDLVEEFRGKIIPKDEFSEKLFEIMDEYNNETFWHELETRFGQREFDRTKTEEEMREIRENNGIYPDRIHDLYKGWGKEFEKHGIERLEVVDKESKNNE